MLAVHVFEIPGNKWGLGRIQYPVAKSEDFSVNLSGASAV